MQAVGNTFIKLSSITLLALSVNLVGCQTFKNLTGKKDVDAVETAEKSEQGYYNDAIAQIDRGRYNQAIEDSQKVIREGTENIIVNVGSLTKL